MKKEIICPECFETLSKLFHENTFPDEHIKFVQGTAVSAFLCDNCDKHIEVSEKAYALSIWTETTPYFSWEHEFINAKQI